MGLTEIRTYTKNRNRGVRHMTKNTSGENQEEVACCGTSGNYMCWFNTTDFSGLALACLVYMLILYSLAVTIMLVVDAAENTPEYNKWNGSIVIVLIIMALWSHAATMCGDPGAVPHGAKPLSKNIEDTAVQCGMCDNYKPPGSHHDRVSGRCISRMDHFCPWTNNAIGAKNQKNFFLFLIYTNIASFYLYIILALNMVDCNSLSCNKTDPEAYSLPILQVESVVLLFSVIFTTSMIVTQIYSLVTGLGTIDRLQMKSGSPDSAEPIPFEHVFGDVMWRWFIPVDPYFKDEETVLQYRVPGVSSYAKF